MQVKKEAGTDSDNDWNDLCNFLTQLKNSDQPDKVAVCKRYTRLSRYDKQKKEMLFFYVEERNLLAPVARKPLRP